MLQVVLAACKIVPDGVLMFLPSYSLMNKLCSRWQVRPYSDAQSQPSRHWKMHVCLACEFANQQGDLYGVSPEHCAHCRTGSPILLQATGTWAQICALKTVVSEPRGTGDNFDSCMTEYYAAIKSGKGGLMMAVCRGKVGLCKAGEVLAIAVANEVLAVMGLRGTVPGCLCKAQVSV